MKTPTWDEAWRGFERWCERQFENSGTEVLSLSTADGTPFVMSILQALAAKAQHDAAKGGHAPPDGKG